MHFAPRLRSRTRSRGAGVSALAQPFSAYRNTIPAGAQELGLTDRFPQARPGTELPSPQGIFPRVELPES